MSREAPVEDAVLTPEKLSDVPSLRRPTRTSRRSSTAPLSSKSVPPEEADIVECGEHSGERGFLPVRIPTGRYPLPTSGLRAEPAGFLGGLSPHRFALSPSTTVRPLHDLSHHGHRLLQRSSHSNPHFTSKHFVPSQLGVSPTSISVSSIGSTHQISSENRKTAVCRTPANDGST